MHMFVLISRFQKPFDEVNLSFASHNDIPIVKGTYQ